MYAAVNRWSPIMVIPKAWNHANPSNHFFKINERANLTTYNQPMTQSTPPKKRLPTFWLLYIGGPRAGYNPRLPVISAVELRLRGGLHIKAYRQAGTGTFVPIHNYRNCNS